MANKKESNLMIHQMQKIDGGMKMLIGLKISLYRWIKIGTIAWSSMTVKMMNNKQM